jgi:hypothetical protein
MYQKSDNILYLFLSTLLMFVCAGLRQTGLVGLFLIALMIIATKREWKDRFHTLCFLLAFIIILVFISWIVLFKYQFIQNLLNKVFYSFKEYFKYITDLKYYSAILIEGIPLLIYSFLGLAAAVKRKKIQDKMLIFWFTLFFIAAILPPSFGHYYIHIIPAGSILSAIGLSVLINSKIKCKNLIVSLIMLVFLMSFTVQALHFWRDNFLKDPTESGGGYSYKEQIELADFIKKNTNENNVFRIQDYCQTYYWLSERKYLKWPITMTLETWENYKRKPEFSPYYAYFTLIQNLNEIKYIIFFPKYEKTYYELQFLDWVKFHSIINNNSLREIGKIKIYTVKNYTYRELGYFCNSINSSLVRDECNLLLALKSENITICENILNESIRQRCLGTDTIN